MGEHTRKATDIMSDQLSALTANPESGAVTKQRALVTLLVIANITYPFALELFFRAIGPAVGGSLAAGVDVAISLALAFVTPALGFATILHLGPRVVTSATALRVRRLAHFSVAAPPLYTATGVILFTLDLPGWDRVIWSAGWLVILALLLALPAPRQRTTDGVPPNWLRWSHGLAAATVLAGYVLLHLGNHLVALAGGGLHKQVQEILRLWYRAPVVEPVLIVLMIWLIGTGILLARHRTLSFTDGWGALQTASGAYLGAFLFSHMTAALVMARAKFGVDTTWDWAAGEPVGLLGDAWNVRLIPHYLMAVAAVSAHVACGLRVVLLAHGAPREKADAVARILAGAGTILALTLVAALLGLRL